MSATFLDLESILDQVLAFLKENLNDKIEDLNDEKADDIVLPKVDNDAYMFLSLNDKVANFNPFVVLNIQQVDSESIGGSTARRYQINVFVVMVDAGQDVNIGRKILRYGRVFSSLFESNFRKINPALQFEIKDLEPVAFRLLDSSDNYRAVGVTLGFDYA